MQNNVLEYFERGALALMPEKIGILDGDKSYTFSDINIYAKAYAAAILSHTQLYGQPIVVFLPKCAETVFANLGILYSGNCYANFDVKSPPERLKATLRKLGEALIITSADFISALIAAGASEEKILLVESIGKGNESVWSDAALQARVSSVIDTDPLCIIHTSGSTGVPKGVALNHRSTIDFVDWACEQFSLNGSDIIGSLSPFYFDIYTLELYFCLAKGATLCIIPEQLAIFPSKLLDYLIGHSVSFIFWVPTIMVNIANLDLLAKKNICSVRKILFAGEVFPVKHLNYWRRNVPEAIFVNLYGPIEAAVDCTYFVVDREMRDDEKLPIGFPCRNSDILIFTDANQLAGINEHGELCIRGSSLALGYWNDSERTSKAFVQNPLQAHYPEIIYKTGDIVYRNEHGEIMFVGRKDHQIKHSGYRIELGEIEHAALAMEEISNACVIYDSLHKEIVLHYESAREIAPGEIRYQLGLTLPKYMLPSRFKRLVEMPKNPNGKIDRMALLENQ